LVLNIHGKQIAFETVIFESKLFLLFTSRRKIFIIALGKENQVLGLKTI